MKPPFLQYLRSGLSIIPIATDGTKKPTGIGSWKQYAETPATEDECRAWEARHAGIAILGGKASGNLEVLDIDSPELAKPMLALIREESPALYEILTLVRTPRRDANDKAGCHVYYRCDAVEGNQKLAMTEPLPVIGDDGGPVLDQDGNQKLASQTLIETRGSGGYVLSPGCSPQCHLTGNLYEHVSGPPITDIHTITADQREILFRCARLFDRSVVQIHQEPKVSGYSGGTRPGDEFSARMSWPDILEPVGWAEVGTSGGITRWRRPGKSQGWSATTGIQSQEGNELLCVFSTNADPFEGPASGRQCSSYSKFAAYALIHHRGDFPDAARELARLGYGDQPTKTQQPAKLLIKTLHQYASDYINDLEADKEDCIGTGIPGLDDALGGGVALGELVVVGAYSSHGKTALAFQMLMESATHGHHGVIISQEMPGKSLGKRAVQRLVDIPVSEWRSNIQFLRDRVAVLRTHGQIMVVEAQPNITAVERAITAACGEFDITYAVVDYMQLVPSDNANQKRYEAVSDVSRRLKQLATKHGIVIVAPSQCSDRGQAKANKPPTEHDLRDSGNIANDADVIITAHWPWKNDPDVKKNLYTLRVWKNRNRAVDAQYVHLDWHPHRQIFNAGLAPYPPIQDHPNYRDDFAEYA